MSGKKKHRTADELLQYMRGELSNQERYALESEMEADPFEKEAMEGLEDLIPGEAEADILSLNARLRKRLARRRRIAIYSAAATVGSLLIIGTIFIQIFDISPRTADETISEKELPLMTQEQETADMETGVEAEVEEPLAEAELSSEPALAEAVESEEDIEVDAGKRDAKGPSSKEVPVVTQPEPAREEVVVADDEVLRYADESPVEEIVVVEAVPVREQYAAAPAEKGAAVKEEKSAAVQEEKRIRRERSAARTQAVPEEDLDALQFGQVSGVVISAEDLEPLPGANVVVKGGDTGVVADMEGRFALPAEEDASTTLIASFIGMETRVYSVVGGSEVELVMEPDMTSLDEVVVVGYPAKEFDESISVAEPSTGYSAFKQYIEENIQFPDSETATTRAVVILKFTIAANGEIRDIRPLRSPGPNFTEEATRLLIEGPSWNPASSTSGITDEEVRLRIVFKR